MFAAVFGKKYAKTYQPLRCELDFKTLVELDFSFTDFYHCTSIINYKLLDKLDRRCMKEKLTNAMRVLEEMLEICLSSRQ